MATTRTPTVANDPNELIEFEAFYDDDRYKDDIFVAVNGRRYQIKRGVKVKIPRFVYEVIMNSIEQDKATADLMERESRRYTESLK